MTQPHLLPHPLRHRRRVDNGQGAEIHAIHLVGICGSGLRALAEYATDMGWRISGSDNALSDEIRTRWRARGWQVCSGHHENAVPAHCDLLVYSAAIGPENVERKAAQQRSIPQMSYSQMLGHLMTCQPGVCVAGTHGKSTTTAMTARILKQAALEPAAIFGAELQDAETTEFPASAWAGAGEFFVAEACEFQRSFLNLHPRFAAITGIEADHFDYFKDFSDTTAAFREFAQKLPTDGTLVIRGDCPVSVEVAETSAAEVVTYSLKAGADWWATDIKRRGTGVRFRVFFRGWFFTEITLRIPGQHNIENALAACALAHAAGADSKSVREGLADFQGLRRRFEPVGMWRGVTMIDDYAHHPTEIVATLQTAKACYPQRRIVAVFQPHQLSRTRMLRDEFAQSLRAADVVLIAPVFAARETLTSASITAAAELAERVTENGCPAIAGASLDRIISTLDDIAQPGDVFITMGAGDIDRVYQEFTGRLQQHHTAG